MTTTLFINNKSSHGYRLHDSHGHEITEVHHENQYSIEVAIPNGHNHFHLTRNSNKKKKITFEVNRNGRITKINSNFKVNNLCVGSNLPVGCQDTVNDHYVPIETSVGDGNGIVWGESVCRRVWTPSRSTITIG